MSIKLGEAVWYPTLTGDPNIDGILRQQQGQLGHMSINPVRRFPDGTTLVIRKVTNGWVIQHQPNPGSMGEEHIATDENLVDVLKTILVVEKMSK